MYEISMYYFVLKGMAENGTHDPYKEENSLTIEGLLKTWNMGDQIYKMQSISILFYILYICIIYVPSLLFQYFLLRIQHNYVKFSTFNGS